MPAPISYNLASLSNRPVGYSFMYPLPPSTCTQKSISQPASLSPDNHHPASPVQTQLPWAVATGGHANLKCGMLALPLVFWPQLSFTAQKFAQLMC